MTVSWRSKIAMVAVVALGLVVVPATGASAAQCQLGPSLAEAAARVGIGCPDSIGGDGGAHSWGAPGSACSFGWNSSTYPREMLDYLYTGLYQNVQYKIGSDIISHTRFREGGKVRGDINIITHADKTFEVVVLVDGRAGFEFEVLSFDCTMSSDGPIYYKVDDNFELPLAATPPGGVVTAPDNGHVATRAAMTQLDDPSMYLLRVDVTNTGPTDNFADIHLGLDGWTVEGFPTMPTGLSCTPFVGLSCSYDSIRPGQTVTMTALLRAEGDDTTGVGVAVTNMGFLRYKVNLHAPAVRHPSVVSNEYVVPRP